MSYSDIQIKCIPEEEVFVLRKILLSCPTLRNELEEAVKESGFSDPILFLPRQLHNDPKILKSYLQEIMTRFYCVCLDAGEEQSDFAQPMQSWLFQGAEIVLTFCFLRKMENWRDRKKESL